MTKKTKTKTPSTDLDSDPGDGIGRLIGLCDGIYAFAMTLLAVNVSIPEIASSASVEQVTDAVIALFPQLFIYVTSFLLIALFWLISRRTFRLVRRDDPTFTWLTLLQLMCVAFLPVATGLFDTHSAIPIVVELYAGTLLAIGLLGNMLWGYAQRAKLLDERTDPELIRYYTFRGYISTIVYTLLLIAGIFVPTYARLVLLLLLVYPFMQHLYRAWNFHVKKSGTIS